MAYPESSNTPGWAKRLGVFYLLAVVIAVICCSLVYVQIAQTAPNDPEALEITQARFSAHAGYQTTPPQQLNAAAPVNLPHRIDDKLKGPGVFTGINLTSLHCPAIGLRRFTFRDLQ